MALVVLIGVFMPAACGAGEDSAESADAGSTTTTVVDVTTTEAPVEPPTTEPPPPPATATPTTATPTTARSRPTMTEAPASAPTGVSYSNCSEAKAAGAAPISRGEPGYSSSLDRDDDGIACET